MCLAQGPQSSDAGEARTRGLESSALPLRHCAHRRLLQIIGGARELNYPEMKKDASLLSLLLSF